MTGLTSDQPTYQSIPLDKLFVSDSNIRRRDRRADIDQLARNIETVGLLHPIVVRPAGERYEILIGQRRFEAFKFLDRDTIPARIVHTDLNEFDVLALSFSENVHRKDLEAPDKAIACVYLRDKLGSIQEAARFLGVTPQAVRNWIDYAGVPLPIQEMVQDGRLKKGAATSIWFASKDNPDHAQRIAELVAAKNPAPKQRRRLITAFAEDPSRTPEEVETRALQLQFPVVVEIEFPPNVARALNDASRLEGKDIEDIILEATVAWLQSRQLISER